MDQETEVRVSHIVEIQNPNIEPGRWFVWLTKLSLDEALSMAAQLTESGAVVRVVEETATVVRKVVSEKP